MPLEGIVNNAVEDLVNQIKKNVLVTAHDVERFIQEEADNAVIRDTDCWKIYRTLPVEKLLGFNIEEVNVRIIAHSIVSEGIEEKLKKDFGVKNYTELVELLLEKK